MRIIPIVGVTALAAAAGCGEAELRDQYDPADRSLPFEQRLRYEVIAPVIVLGRILAVHEMGKPRPSVGDHRIKTVLNRIEIQVEEVIKGTIPSPRLEFYYFVYSAMASETDLRARRYLPKTGQRRIYFLKPTKKAYRSVGDITDYTLPVRTGSRQRGVCKEQSPGCCIAELMLVPQGDVDTAWFVTDLPNAEFVAETLCSRRTARELLQNLTRHPDKRIAERAAEVIQGTDLLQ